MPAELTIQLRADIAAALREADLDVDSPAGLMRALLVGAQAITQGRAERETAAADATADTELTRTSFEMSQALISQLEEVIRAVGMPGALQLLRQYPLGLAKGRSLAELDLMRERYERGLDTRIIVTVRPGETKFPIEVHSLGSDGVVGSARGCHARSGSESSGACRSVECGC